MFEPTLLKGQVAVVTGGGTGLGLAIARRLGTLGARIAIASRNAGHLEAGCTALSEAGVDALAVQLDVRKPEQIDEMVERTVKHFGSLDILVNNAGIYPMVPMADLDVETFRRVIDVNLTGLFLCTKAASARMIAQGKGGRIVNITSIDALHPSMVGLAHYDASKHGAWGFTKNVALELAPHEIWVNAIAPGGIRTPGIGEMDPKTLEGFEAMIPMHRMGDPDDIGRAVLFLASALASYMTGTQIVVDGGRLLA